MYEKAIIIFWWTDIITHVGFFIYKNLSAQILGIYIFLNYKFKQYFGKFTIQITYKNMKVWLIIMWKLIQNIDKELFSKLILKLTGKVYF